MNDPRALCICGHFYNEHYTFTYPNRAGGCAAHRGTVRTAWEPCDCPRFEEYDEEPFNEPDEPELDKAKAWGGVDLAAEFWGGR